MRWYRLLPVVGILQLSLRTSSQDCDNLAGRWINELGSVLEITNIRADGSINGRYLSSTGVDGTIFPLSGWVNKEEEGTVPSITFSVRWEGYGSITSWTGSCDVDKEGPFILTLWHLVRPEQKFSWERIIANSSTFRPE